MYSEYGHGYTGKEAEMTSHEEMQRLARKWNIDINDMFCGYIRQPIIADELDEGVIVWGTCCLTGKRCQKYREKNYAVQEMSCMQKILSKQ